MNTPKGIVVVGWDGRRFGINFEHFSCILSKWHGDGEEKEEKSLMCYSILPAGKYGNFDTIEFTLKDAGEVKKVLDAYEVYLANK